MSCHRPLATTNTMHENITLRFAKRSDISALAHIANAANAQSALHRRIARYQEQYPDDYYRWRLNIIRQRFATPDLRTIVAVDNATGQVLGQASWAVEGSETALYKRWVAEHAWLDWLEAQLIWAEKKWCEYVTDRSVDYKFLGGFIAAFLGSKRPARPACLHCHLIVIDPNVQSKGLGKKLMEWGKKLAVQEDLPLYLESNLEATGFYEKMDFARMSNDCIIEADEDESFHVPAFVWEGKEREGQWLERDLDANAGEERWKWKDDVFR